MKIVLHGCYGTGQAYRWRGDHGRRGLTLTVPSHVSPTDLLHIYMPMVMTRVNPTILLWNWFSSLDLTCVLDDVCLVSWMDTHMLTLLIPGNGKTHTYNTHRAHIMIERVKLVRVQDLQVEICATWITQIHRSAMHPTQCLKCKTSAESVWFLSFLHTYNFRDKSFHVPMGNHYLVICDMHYLSVHDHKSHNIIW